ncbi:hypothetical protein U2P60_02765 [Brucella sp. H1_1004]|uniref:hypothetical protein n=1 Tax=Brucella sp. H1_1004 TaxID=3110109 RepID=UPI0039B383E5
MSATNDKRLSACFGQSVQDGEAIARTIQEAAEDLSFLMSQLHGESFSADINHDLGFLLSRLHAGGDDMFKDAKPKGASS